MQCSKHHSVLKADRQPPEETPREWPVSEINPIPIDALFALKAIGREKGLSAQRQERGIVGKVNGVDEREQGHAQDSSPEGTMLVDAHATEQFRCGNQCQVDFDQAFCGQFDGQSHATIIVIEIHQCRVLLTNLLDPGTELLKQHGMVAEFRRHFAQLKG